MKVHLMTCLKFGNPLTRPTVIFFTDDLSNMFPMPEIQKPPNLCFLKITQKRIESQNIYRNNVFGHIIRLARTCLVNSSLFVSVSWLDKPARLSFSCSLDLLLISIKQIWIEISKTVIGCLVLIQHQNGDSLPYFDQICFCDISYALYSDCTLPAPSS